MTDNWAELRKRQREGAAVEPDPECPPLSEEELAAFRPMSPVKRLRLRLGLTQKEFCE